VRTVYLGTSDFAATVLERLAGSEHRPRLVVTRPDAPKGRGRKLAPPPVKLKADELGIETVQPQSVNGDEALERIADEEPEALLLCAYGALIKEPLLSRFGPIRNVHPSLLPRWRGAAPVERSMMAGDSETGVTIMAVTEDLDAGPIYVQEREPILPEDTYGTLTARLAPLSADLLVRALDEDREPTPQPDDGEIVYAEKITPEDRTLDPQRHTAAELERTVRALTPHIGARISLDGGELLGVRAAAVGERPDAVNVPTTDGTLALTVVQPPGGKPMPAADYLRGHQR
jgi:methionyl-tRNA formyltransferase